MNRTEYYRGKANIKYGIWNDVSKQFQFNISEDTPFLAIARLYQKIGDDAKKARFEPKRLPEKRDKVLRDTVAELCEAKRLLKIAVPIINNSFPEVGSCWGCANYDEEKDECKGGAFAKCSEVCKWEHADEALALIGEDGDAK